MKLICCYTVFNGLELLEKSIEQIYNYVDEIIICTQKFSNTRLKGNEFIPKSIYAKEKIFFCEYEPDFKLNTKANERAKHNLLINEAKKRGATHFFLSAVDHFFLKEDFIKAKIKARNYDVTLTQMYTYFKKPTWQLDPPEDYWMPFICKLYPHTEFTPAQYNQFHTDPSVRINTRETIYGFPRHEISMYHYSAVRKDITNKFRNAAASIRWTPEIIKGFEDEFKNYDIQKNEGVKYFGGRKIKEVPDIFELAPIFQPE